MDWLDSVFDLDSWGDAVSSFYDDSGLDTLVSGIGNLFSDGGLTDGLEDIFGGIGDKISGAANFTLGSLFGVPGDTPMKMESEDGINATLPSSEPASKGLIGNVVDWTGKNPSAAKIASGLISGASKGYFANKKLEQDQKQFDAMITAQQKNLRDRYDYEVDAKKKDRTNTAQEYMNAYGAK